MKLYVQWGAQDLREFREIVSAMEGRVMREFRVSREIGEIVCVMEDEKLRKLREIGEVVCAMESLGIA